MATFFLGQIIAGGWNFAPKGSALCNGQIMSIQQNTALFSLLGTFYGGNGTSTFGLPDLRGRSMINQGTGLGLPTYVIGENGGNTQVSVLQQNMPNHSHTIAPSSFSASGLTPDASTQAPAAGSVLGHAKDIASGGTAKPAIYCPTGTATTVNLAGLSVPTTTGVAGGSVPLQIQNPYLAVSLAIVTSGIFPSRN
jgi:microcystin-dependent protein